MSAVVLRGDAAHLPLPDESVDLLLCSPPYWSLRSYADGGEHYTGQIGSEASPHEFVDALLACTREWVRVLKPGGSMFVNLGDKYAQDEERSRNGLGQRSTGLASGPVLAAETVKLGRRDNGGIQRKSLLGLPWRYALGCVDDLGLILRAEIVWSKPNGLPESVADRVRRSHEQVFHFTKQPRYFTAVDEIREPHAAPGRQAGANAFRARDANLRRTATGDYEGQNPLGKLPGSVWEIPSAPLIVPAWLGVDHFAAYPPELCRRIILGWSPSGICLECGEGRRPVASSVRTFDGQPRDDLPVWADPAAPRRTPNGAGHWRFGTDRRHLGYACACAVAMAPTRPAVVVDPFGGTGTTALVADVLGRIGVSVELSADYCRLARWRTRDPAERARALGVPKPPPVPEGQASLFDEAS